MYSLWRRVNGKGKSNILYNSRELSIVCALPTAALFGIFLHTFTFLTQNFVTPTPSNVPGVPQKVYLFLGFLAGFSRCKTLKIDISGDSQLKMWLIYEKKTFDFIMNIPSDYFAEFLGSLPLIVWYEISIFLEHL